MIDEFKIPDGYVLVKKGGRPKKTKRDIAVFIAHILKKDELKTAAKANEWIMEEFNLGENRDVRTCRTNARNIIGNRYIAIGIEKAFFIIQAIKDRDGNISVKAGAIGYGWTEGLKEAIELEAINTSQAINPLMALGCISTTESNSNKW